MTFLVVVRSALCCEVVAGTGALFSRRRYPAAIDGGQVVRAEMPSAMAFAVAIEDAGATAR